ncbi:hypothetical protein [Bradyrhizobium sp. DOA9]|uniref:hypothetical protein n=1 Tax=Bradyrhizobium sp. DOA9 TaxID=1126627 RepID=UPI0007237BD7|nr:hypothetical protein [Bradyrhizobium sp. DOA9]GAJ37126.1 hypothetical protein BDOA9_0163450 [Bradyrhizobium sp. DOA9]
MPPAGRALAGDDGDVPACVATCPSWHPAPEPAEPNRVDRLIQAALIVRLIGLRAASALILARSTDRTIAALLLTAMVAAGATISRIIPLWLLLAGGVLSFAGIV